MTEREKLFESDEAVDGVEGKRSAGIESATPPGKSSAGSP
jgi:hypothetical protein